MSYYHIDWLPAYLVKTYDSLTPVKVNEIVAAFRGYESETERDVLLNVLLPELSASPRAVTRFKEEARAATRLVHPHIVQVLLIGETAGVPYLVTNSVPAESLRAKLAREQTLPVQTVRAITAQIGAALRHAHQHGVIHRGLTPERILVTKTGHVYVDDFGIAAARHTFSLAQLGMVMGVPEYLPPEGVTGTFTRQSDLYALALIVYELCTGTVPFRDDDPLTILRRQANERPQFPSERGIAIEPAFERALLKALNKQPEERFSDVDTMLRALGVDSLADSGASDGTSRSTGIDPAAPQPAREDGVGVSSPRTARNADPADQEPRSAPAYSDWRQSVREGLTTLIPASAVLLVALLFTVMIVVGLLTASLRSLSGGPLEQNGRTLAGVVTPTLVLSATNPLSTPTTLSTEQSTVQAASPPTRTTVPSATALLTAAAPTTLAQEARTMATGASSPSPAEAPSTMTPTAGVAESDDTSTTVRALAPLNIRSGPAPSFTVSGSLQNGEAMTVLGQNSDGDWLYVASPAGTEGWVAREFTSFEGSAPIRPEPTQPATPSPVVVATPSPTPIPPASPTSTADSTVAYDAPQLELPSDGATHAAPFSFQWTWNGMLADNEYFDVRVWQEGEPHLGIAWTKVSQLRLETTSLRGTYRWTVAVVRGENGQWQADLSPEAPPRTLSVVAPDESSGETNPNPAPQPTHPPQPTQPPQPPPSPTR